jgi:hypothetical protein
MKDIIEKMVKEEGFEIGKLIEEFRHPEYEAYHNAYDLLFNKKLGFVEALDNRVACGLYKHCVCMPACSASQEKGDKCRHYGLSTMAFHHRRELVNLDSIDDMVEYLRKICEQGRKQ